MELIPAVPRLAVSGSVEAEQVREVLRDVRSLVDRYDLGRDDRQLLDQAERDLADLFHLVVLGEFNVGKSAMLNALLGTDILEVGATPTTQVVQVIRYSDQPYERYLSDTLLERGLPVRWLENLSLVDTPGTNATIREHERITTEFVPRADLVLFVTSADRPFTESERAYLERIRDWGKKIVLILNKRDLLSDRELAEVLEFVRGNARSLLGLDPPIFPVSARLAAAARQTADEAARDLLRERSGFPELERFVFTTLDDRARIRLKLLSPLGLLVRLLEGYRKEAAARLDLLRGDATTLETIDRQTTAFSEEIRRDVRSRIQAIENVILDLNERGDRFFAETVRIGRLPDLLRPDRIRTEFDRDVLADTASKVDREVGNLVDWLVEREGKYWHDVFDFFERRRQAGDERLIGRIGGAFTERRRDLLGAVGAGTRRVVDSFDRERQSYELATSFRDAIAQTALAQVGAVSLGALIAVLVGTVAADVTGILAASVLGGLALFILPRRRERARRDFRERTAALRERLVAVLQDQVERELGAIAEHLAQALGPYRRFVETERGQLEELSTGLERADERSRVLRRTLGATD